MTNKKKNRRPRYSTYDKGPFCGRNRSHGKGKCKNFAGFRTDHPGQGACYKHGGNHASKGRALVHGRYAKIRNRQVTEAMEQLLAMQDDAMDLIPEANLLRALLIDYINRYDEFVEALMAWYMDPETTARPRRALDITDAASLAESISRIVERMHRIQSEGAISLVTFKRVTEMMAIVVTKYVKDPKTIEQISNEWDHLALDAKNTPIPDDDDASASDSDDED